MPKTLPTLWDEHVNGCGGGKPARDFTSKDRSPANIKYKHSRRIIIWRCMERLIGNGATINVAVDRITRAYGHVSMTELSKLMNPDEKRGGHADLRV